MKGFGPITGAVMLIFAIVFSVIAINNNQIAVDTHKAAWGITEPTVQNANSSEPLLVIVLLVMGVLGFLYYYLNSKGKLEPRHKKLFLIGGGAIAFIAVLIALSAPADEKVVAAPVNQQTAQQQTPAVQQQAPVIQKQYGKPPQRFNKDGWEDFDKQFEGFDDKFKNF